MRRCINIRQSYRRRLNGCPHSRYEKKQREEGHQVNHAFAKEMLAGIAGAEVGLRKLEINPSPMHLGTYLGSCLCWSIVTASNGMQQLSRFPGAEED